MSRIFERKATESVNEWGMRLAKAAADTEKSLEAGNKKMERIFVAWRKQVKASTIEPAGTSNGTGEAEATDF